MATFKSILNFWNSMKLFLMISLYFNAFQNQFLSQIIAIASRNYFPCHIIKILFSSQNPVPQYIFMRVSLSFTNFEDDLKTFIKNIGFFKC
jgi:hypothetical protein